MVQLEVRVGGAESFGGGKTPFQKDGADPGQGQRPLRLRTREPSSQLPTLAFPPPPPTPPPSSNYLNSSIARSLFAISSMAEPVVQTIHRDPALL